MKRNVTFSIGNLAVIDKVDAQYGYFQRIFGNLYGKAKNLIPSTKLFIYNRLGDCYSVNKLKKAYPNELFDRLSFSTIPSDRSLYREIERIGKKYQFIMERHQSFLKSENLISQTQFIDFSSSYFEGNKSELGELGYSRDNQPGKKQITFGVSVGINTIPSALTIQKGNVVDKQHFDFMLKTAKAVLEDNSVLIFDNGANTKKNKKKVRELNFHYLTLKAKKVSPYKKLIAYFNEHEKTEVELNSQKYQCVKLHSENEIQYIFHSEELKTNQLALKERKFRRETKKNKSLLDKTKKGKAIATYLTEEGTIHATGSLQKTLEKVPNPYINGVEGYFIIESSIDTEPRLILALYKDKDKAEKLIRNMKEGTELRPIRHWSTNAIIGYILIIFLTNFLINLTLWLAKNPLVKNAKLLKKYLCNLTLAVIYPKTGFKFQVVANISEEISSIFGNYVDKYGDKSLKNRW